MEYYSNFQRAFLNVYLSCHRDIYVVIAEKRLIYGVFFVLFGVATKV